MKFYLLSLLALLVFVTPMQSFPISPETDSIVFRPGDKEKKEKKKKEKKEKPGKNDPGTGNDSQSGSANMHGKYNRMAKKDQKEFSYKRAMKEADKIQRELRRQMTGKPKG
jgi:hypothetical protein